MSASDYEISPIIDLEMSKVMIENCIQTDGYDVHVLVKTNRDSCDILMPLANPVIRHVPRGEYCERVPAFRLGRQSAKALMDGLWAAGVRPSSGDQGSSGVLKAVTDAMQAHIDDLRAVLHISTTADQPQGAPAQFS